MTANDESSNRIAPNGSPTEESAEKKKKKRSPMLIAAIVLDVIIVAMLITLAFFTSFDEVTNVFGGGRVDIVLTEPNWDQMKAQNIVPETVLDKDPYVTNYEETAVYVFLEVLVPYGDVEIENNDNNKGEGTVYTEAPLYKFGVLDNDNGPVFDTELDQASQLTNIGWLLLAEYPEKDTENHVYRYVYAHVDPITEKLIPLAKGVTTQYPLFNKLKLVNLDENYSGTTNYSVPVKAYGIQSNFLTSDNKTTDDPSVVWDIIKR